MFERFTERSRRVVVLAQEEARMLEHNYIGTEHLLLGLIHEGDSIAAQAIESTGLTLDVARAHVEALIGRGDSAPSGHIPFTPRAKKVLELALREALALKKSYIGPEHILLGLIREGDGIGAQILERLAAPLALLRAQVIELAGAEGAEGSELGRDEPVTAEWLAGPGFRRQARAATAAQAEVFRVQVVTEFRATLSLLGETLEGLDRRLAAIERQLGIAAVSPEEPAAAEEDDAPTPQEDDAPADDAPGESAG
jgi:ATP-dependent Clp protease ATP-binding subunit ClpA